MPARATIHSAARMVTDEMVAVSCSDKCPRNECVFDVECLTEECEREERCKALYLSRVRVQAMPTGRTWSKHGRLCARSYRLEERATFRTASQPQVLNSGDTKARKGNNKRTDGRVA